MEKKQLREAGLKVTGPRIKVLQILQQANPHHLSAEDIHTHLRNSGDEVALATIYRVLMQLVDTQLVQRHNFEGDVSVFECMQQAHHDHMVCTQCSQVTEFVDEVIEKRQAQIATKHHFTMTDHNLTIYGICASCAKNTKPSI